jgi:hypothetical protein
VNSRVTDGAACLLLETVPDANFDSKAGVGNRAASVNNFLFKFAVQLETQQG